VTSSVIGQLILKDWRLNRQLISLCIGVGLIALVLAQYAGQVVRLVGAVWFFVSLCVLGSMLPISAIVNERKKQTLAFVMSLPVSSVQYAMAKALSTSAMFLVPWLTLLISALVLIETRHVIPHGVIPMLLILAMLPLIVFCLISAVAMVGESEGGLMAASIVCNSSYWFVWYLLARTPSLTANWSGPVAVWNPAEFIVLSAELGSIAFIVGLALFFQSRKRDFI
jgi:ABC-2 type transport system permease protein